MITDLDPNATPISVKHKCALAGIRRTYGVPAFIGTTVEVFETGIVGQGPVNVSAIVGGDKNQLVLESGQKQRPHQGVVYFNDGEGFMLNDWKVIGTVVAVNEAVNAKMEQVATITLCLTKGYGENQKSYDVRVHVTRGPEKALKYLRTGQNLFVEGELLPGKAGSVYCRVNRWKIITSQARK